MSSAQPDEDPHRIEEVFARVRDILIARAREGRTISYGELATATRLSPQSTQFNAALNGVSRSEEAAGRGLLSVLVVRQRQETPGAGFFTLARELGRQFSNERVFYLEESERVIAQWQGRPAEELDLLDDHVVEELSRFYSSDDYEHTASSGAPTSEKDNSLQALVRGVANVIKRTIKRGGQ